MKRSNRARPGKGASHKRGRVSSETLVRTMAAEAARLVALQDDIVSAAMVLKPNGKHLQVEWADRKLFCKILDDFNRQVESIAGALETVSGAKCERAA